MEHVLAFGPWQAGTACLCVGPALRRLHKAEFGQRVKMRICWGKGHGAAPAEGEGQGMSGGLLATGPVLAALSQALLRPDSFALPLAVWALRRRPLWNVFGGRRPGWAPFHRQAGQEGGGTFVLLARWGVQGSHVPAAQPLASCSAFLPGQVTSCRSCG